MKTLAVVLIVMLLAGCSVQSIDSAMDAKAVADKAMDNYCKETVASDCLDLAFVNSQATNGMWLVEYKSSGYLHGVIVQRDGAVELTKMREDE